MAWEAVVVAQVGSVVSCRSSASGAPSPLD